MCLRLALVTGCLLGLLFACGPQPTATPVADPLAGGVLATFDVVGEQFKVWVTNPVTVQQLLDLQAGQSQANIPNGRIFAGPGAGAHNVPYGWHLDPVEIEMAEMTIELCDGTPSFVEDELDYFVTTVQRYCPWSARLVAIEDHR